MNNLWYDLFLAIVSAILGASFGVIIPKLLKDKTESTEIYVDKQLVFSQIHIEQKQYTVNTAGYQKQNSNSTNKSQSTSGGEMFCGALVIAIVLVFGFLKYEKEISTVILCTFVFLETTFLTTAYVIVKKCYVRRKNEKFLLPNNIFKSEILFNIALKQFEDDLLELMQKEIKWKIESISESSKILENICKFNCDLTGILEKYSEKLYIDIQQLTENDIEKARIEIIKTSGKYIKCFKSIFKFRSGN